MRDARDREAAEISGLSYPEVHRRATTGQIPGAVQADDGTWSIRRLDAAQFEGREPANDKRHAVMLRPDVERYEAKRRGLAVSEPANNKRHAVMLRPDVERYEAKRRGLAVSELAMQR